MNVETLKIVLVDDHQMMRNGLCPLLEQQAGWKVVGHASTAEEALRLSDTLVPDLIVMDVNLPDASGVEAMRQILARHPAIRILMLSAIPDPQVVDEALQAGASGYVLKEDAFEDLKRAIIQVLSGKIYLSVGVVTPVIDSYKRVLASKKAVSTGPSLSERERQVLKLVVQGMRNKEIAEVLGVNIKSVETYRSRLMTKLHCSGSVELVRYAVKEGLAVL